MSPLEKVICITCGEPIQMDHPCYEIRYGTLNNVSVDDEVPCPEFSPEEDIGFTHTGSCLPRFRFQ